MSESKTTLQSIQMLCDEFWFQINGGDEYTMGIKSSKDPNKFWYDDGDGIVCGSYKHFAKCPAIAIEKPQVGK